MQTKTSIPKDGRIMPEMSFPRFRHYPFIRVLGIFDLHRGPMNDYFAYLLAYAIGKIVVLA